jgi:hypothetical protein
LILDVPALMRMAMALAAKSASKASPIEPIQQKEPS